MHVVLLKVPLVAAGVLQDSTLLTVQITVAHDVTIGNTFDSDIRYGISDGSRFVGFEVCDKGDYADNAPCYGVEGVPGVSLSSIRHIDHKSFKTSDSHYPGLFDFTLHLNERWGSCYTANDGGYTKTTQYNNRLKFSKGLSLEVYKSDSGERVGVKYIKVVVVETSITGWFDLDVYYYALVMAFVSFSSRETVCMKVSLTLLFLQGLGQVKPDDI